jgi:hypothetical protein
VEDIYKEFKDGAEFLFVYIREAHPSNGSWGDPESATEDPLDLEGRNKVAGTCTEKLKLTMPTAVDDMDDTVNLKYSAWPERIYIIGKDGKVLYKSKLGPFGFKPTEAKKELEKLLGDQY